jgi:hypothetical protein
MKNINHQNYALTCVKQSTVSIKLGRGVVLIDVMIIPFPHESMRVHAIPHDYSGYAL